MPDVSSPERSKEQTDRTTDSQTQGELSDTPDVSDMPETVMKIKETTLTDMSYVREK